MMMSRSSPRGRRILDVAPPSRPRKPGRHERQRLSELILMVTAAALGASLVTMFLRSLAS